MKKRTNVQDATLKNIRVLARKFVRLEERVTALEAAVKAPPAPPNSTPADPLADPAGNV
jgi:hypothetical protein